MAVICIAGAAEGIGKTAVAELLLPHLRGWHVARVRIADEIPPAEAATLAERGYRLVPPSAARDPESERLAAAGSTGVTVLLAEPRGLEDGLRALLRDRRPDEHLLIEGNAYLWARPADAAIMVIGAGPSGKGLVRVRPSVREIFKQIGIWAWNTRSDLHAEGFFEFPQALARMGLKDAISNRADFHDVHPPQADYAGNAAFIECVLDTIARQRGK